MYQVVVQNQIAVAQQESVLAMTTVLLVHLVLGVMFQVVQQHTVLGLVVLQQQKNVKQ